MRNLIFFVSFLFSGLSALAQTANLVVYTEAKETFTLLLANERINRLPVRNLKLTGVEPGQYEVQVIFNNPSLPRVAHQVELHADRELTLAVHQDNNGQWGLIFVNEFKLGYLPIAPQGQMLLAHSNLNQSETKVDDRNPDLKPAPKPAADQNPNNTREVPVSAPAIATPPNPMPGYSGHIGCASPMNVSDFSKAKEAISAKSFSDSKKQLAKQITRSNCLLTDQVMELLMVMNFESDKLDFAKFAFEHTYDQDNYYKINEVFSFESSIRELETYLAGIR